MINSPARKVEIHIPSELGYEKAVMATAATVAQRMGFSSERIEDLKTAVAEAVTNAIEHGNRFNSEIDVLTFFTIEKTSLALSVVDQGHQPIPPIPPEHFRQVDNRGWGMFLIKNLVDEVEVAAHPGRNEMRMVIYLEQ